MLLAVASAVFAAGLPRLRTDVGYRAFLGETHPSVRDFDRFLGRFGGGLPLVAVWSCAEIPACDGALDAASLAMAAAVARALEGQRGVRAVVSPATAVLLVPSPLGPETRTLMSDGRPVADREELAAIALEDPLWVGQLVSADGRTGAIVVELASSDGELSARVFHALRAELAPFEARGFRYSFVGGPVEFVVAGEELERETARLVPVMVGLIGVTLVLLLRHWPAALSALFCVGIAVLWSFGLLGWLGWPQSSLTQALAPLLLAIGVGDAIHLIARYGGERREGTAPREALTAAARAVARPCLLTTLTTAAGFGSFATSDLASFARFGATAAFGVCAALLLTFSLLPLLLLLLPGLGTGAARASGRWPGGLERTALFSQRRALPLLALCAGAAALAASGAARLRVDASFEDLYGERSAVVRWARFVEATLRRPDTLELALFPPAGAPLEDPATLAVVAQQADALEALEGLGRARSGVDLIARLNRALHDGDPRFERPAESTERNRRLLDLIERREPGLLARWLHRGERAWRVSAEAEKPPQERLRRLLAEVRERVAALPAGWRAEVTGPISVVHDLIDDIRATQLRSFAGAAVVVLALVALFLRSWRLALLAAVPTLLPVLLTLGAMGALGIPLDVGTAMVAAVVVGVAVDHAIHLLEAYTRERRAGNDPNAAAVGAVRRVGKALVTSSLALAVGFSALVLSPWQSIASFGLVSALAILTALVATLVAVPAVLALRTGWPRGAP